MDIFTHVLIGSAATSPFWVSHPLESVAFVFGSVLPDIDAMSRQFGKVAYLESHQTWTHAIPLQLAFTALLVGVVVGMDLSILVPAVLALGAGAVVHTLFDWTNTYGVKLFAPFDRKRRSLEWVFFIDAFVIASTSATVALQVFLWKTSGSGSRLVAGFWLVTILVYIALKAAMRARAGRMTGGDSLIPSALWPRHFYGSRRVGDQIETFEFDAGHVANQASVPIYQDAEAQRLREFRAMRSLSSGFSIVEMTPERVVCRDLRTRNNFGTDFGRLVLVKHGEELVVEAFDV